MRRLVWLGVILATLWCGWWAFGSWSLRTGAEAWLQDRRSEGWQADTSSIDVSGFPTQLSLLLSNLIIADPDTGLVVSTDALKLTSPAWWPGHVTVTLPNQSAILASPLTQVELTSDTGRADLRLKPGPTLELEHAGLTSNVWDLSAASGTLWSAQGLVLTLQQSGDTPNQYGFQADAPAFAPGEAIRSKLRIPQDWPIAFDSLSANGVITLDRPIDRSTIEAARPQPRQIDLQLAEAVWGPLLLRTSADLTVSEQGLLSGDVSLQARNWQSMLDLAEASGALPAAIRPQIENVLAALARGSGNPDTLDVSLQLQDGSIFMGFLPFGQLPPLIIR